MEEEVDEEPPKVVADAFVSEWERVAAWIDGADSDSWSEEETSDEEDSGTEYTDTWGSTDDEGQDDMVAHRRCANCLNTASMRCPYHCCALCCPSPACTARVHARRRKCANA